MAASDCAFCPNDLWYRVYSARQAVPGTKKKAAAKQAIHRLDGLYCSHVINKGISAPQLGGVLGHIFPAECSVCA